MYEIAPGQLDMPADNEVQAELRTFSENITKHRIEDCRQVISAVVAQRRPEESLALFYYPNLKHMSIAILIEFVRDSFKKLRVVDTVDGSLNFFQICPCRSLQIELREQQLRLNFLQSVNLDLLEHDIINIDL